MVRLVKDGAILESLVRQVCPGSHRVISRDPGCVLLSSQADSQAQFKDSALPVSWSHFRAQQAGRRASRSSDFESMKVCLAAALAAAVTATAMSQDSPAELLRELQAQRELLEEQRKELKQMTETQESMAGAMDSAWLCLCGALVMFMHAGFAMLETGCCRAKNASNVLMKNLVTRWHFGELEKTIPLWFL